MNGAQDLRSRTVIVTGASSGTGAATVRALHAASARPRWRSSPPAAAQDKDSVTVTRATTAADVFTTTPQLLTDLLVSLADPKSDFAAEYMVPLVYKLATTATFIATLNAISAKLTTAILLRMDNAIIPPARRLHDGRSRLPQGPRPDLTLLSNLKRSASDDHLHYAMQKCGVRYMPELTVRQAREMLASWAG